MQTIFAADAYCGDGKRYVVRADEKLTAFVELESAIQRQKASMGAASAVGQRLIDEGPIDSMAASWNCFMSLIKRI